MPLAERLLLEVPNGIPTAHAALTEPIAVGWHAVQKARLTPDDVALVIGCGPVGLAVIASLKQISRFSHHSRPLALGHRTGSRQDDNG
jgi:threonine dehydrogenase-like Zn-dependent dehydrogenase